MPCPAAQAMGARPLLLYIYIPIVCIGGCSLGESPHLISVHLLLLSLSLSLVCALPISSIGIRAWCGSACGCAESVAAAREARLWSLELGKEESIFRGDFSLLLELALPTTGATDLGHCRE